MRTATKHVKKRGEHQVGEKKRFYRPIVGTLSGVT